MTPTPPSEEPLLSVTPRGARYFTAIMIVVVGIVCGAVIPGTLGGSICTGLVGIGCIGVVSMIFYDVGLTEDRDRARLERMRGRLEGRQLTPNTSHDHPATHLRSALSRRSPARLRGERRRLG